MKKRLLIGFAAVGWECFAFPRMVSIGFDDFRESDFALVLPLFEKYGAEATFNRPVFSTDGINLKDRERMARIEAGGSEIGDHTWKHWNGIFDDPLMNGQNPAAPEGGQSPYPSDAQMREDSGDGCNAFGFPLDDSVDVQLSDFFAYGNNRWTAFDVKWRDLSDAQCQKIRDYFSVYGNALGLVDVFDRYAVRYLGLAGRSRGSWNAERGCYTGGIFSGCRTSANHEIWERILEITKAFYREHYRGDFTFDTWSWPGSIPSPFRFVKDGIIYFDAECTRPFNYLSRFESTRLTDSEGRPLSRSWTEALRAAGYTIAHDTRHPGKKDGLVRTMMQRQMFRNAAFSRRDALAYCTERTIDYEKIAKEFPAERFADSDIAVAAAKMYDAGGSFREFVEATRHETASGLVHGEVIDSENTPSERLFLEAALAFCRSAGIEVVSKREAYRRCFCKTNEVRELMINPKFINSAAKFMPQSKTVPTNPDGYLGDCRVKREGDSKILEILGPTESIVYGVPPGKHTFKLKVRGKGRITVSAIRNRDPLKDATGELLASTEISEDEFVDHTVEFVIPDEPQDEYDPRWEGLGDKVMAIKIVYKAYDFVQLADN